METAHIVQIPGLEGLGGLDIDVTISCLTVTLHPDFGVHPGNEQGQHGSPWDAGAHGAHLCLAEGLSVSLMGPIGKRYTPFCMAIFLFVLVANWIGLIPNFFEWITPWVPQAQALVPILEPATKSANVTLAMALISFLAFMGIGIHRSIERATAPHSHSHDHGGHEHDHGDGHSHGPQGVGGGFVSWLGHYIQPVPSLWNRLDGAMKYGLVPLLLFLFIFLNIVEEVARILSLTFRLYGNIFGEHSVKTQFLNLVGTFSGRPWRVPPAVPSAGAWASASMGIVMWAIVLFVVCLGTLAGFIQAFVFALLTMSYIAHAVAEHH